MPLVSRRQSWQYPRVKDPASEVTVEGNLRVRVAYGEQQAGQRRRIAQHSGVNAANALLTLFRRNVRLDLPTNAGKGQKYGLQAANMARQRRLRSGYIAFRVAFANAWPQPYDPTVYYGEVTLTEIERVASFTELDRGTFTELDRGS